MFEYPKDRILFIHDIQQSCYVKMFLLILGEVIVYILIRLEIKTVMNNVMAYLVGVHTLPSERMHLTMNKFSDS